MGRRYQITRLRRRVSVCKERMAGQLSKNQKSCADAHIPNLHTSAARGSFGPDACAKLFGNSVCRGKGHARMRTACGRPCVGVAHFVWPSYAARVSVWLSPLRICSSREGRCGGAYGGRRLVDAVAHCGTAGRENQRSTAYSGRALPNHAGACGTFGLGGACFCRELFGECESTVVSVAAHRSFFQKHSLKGLFLFLCLQIPRR